MIRVTYITLPECDNTSKLQSNIYMMCYSLLTYQTLIFLLSGYSLSLCILTLRYISDSIITLFCNYLLQYATSDRC